LQLLDSSLANLDKVSALCGSYNTRGLLLTCRTVTGNLTPLSSHKATIPRFRAIRPVRIDIGVHFRGSVDVRVETDVSGARTGTEDSACLTTE
jgi:hypothetical protein